MRAKAFTILLISLLCFPGFPSAQERVTQPNAGSNHNGGNRPLTAMDILAERAPGLFGGYRSNCGARVNSPGIQDVEVLLRLSLTGVDGTMDSTVNVTLNGAFALTGNILGGSPLSITAQGTGGTAFTGQINPGTNHYVIVVPADTYTITVCHAPAPGSIATFNDPNSVVVAGDTTHDVTITPLTTHQVSGTIFNLNPLLPLAFVSFASADGSAGGSTIVFPGTNQYQIMLPDGTFNAFLNESSFGMPAQSETLPLGSVTVSGADVAMDFTAPVSSTLSGIVSTADGSPPPSGSVIVALDATVALVPGCATAGPASGFAGIDPASGSYQVILPRNHTYTVIVAMPLQPSQPPQSASSFGFQDPSTILLSMDMMLNETFPPVPGTVSITGTVTDPGGVGVASTQVTAFTNMVTGAANAFYSRSTTTDANGLYALTLLNGSNYAMGFNPPQPAP